MMVRSLCYVTIEVRDFPIYDKLGEVDDFLTKFEKEVPEQQRFDALKWTLRTTPTRWWGTHQRSFEDYRECRRMLLIWFGKPQMKMKVGYDGWNSLRAHLSRWVKVYGTQPTRTHTILTIGNATKKQERARWWHERQSMIRRSAPNIIRGEAFDKVCKVLNMVHHVRCTD